MQMINAIPRYPSLVPTTRTIERVTSEKIGLHFFIEITERQQGARESRK
jgi:hypothetical protein